MMSKNYTNNAVSMNNKVASNSTYSGSRAKPQNTSDLVKLPKVTNGSNKNIEAKKPTEQIRRVNNSRDRGRIAL